MTYPLFIQTMMNDIQCVTRSHELHISCLLSMTRPLSFSFWPRLAARGILFPQPRIEPKLPALEAQSLNHWAVREVLTTRLF